MCALASPWLIVSATPGGCARPTHVYQTRCDGSARGRRFVLVHKGYEGRGPKTWVSLSRAGARTLEQELAVLRTLVSRLEGRPDPAG